MLKKFEVKDFKNFKSNIELDFSDVRDYHFNENCINDDLLNKIIIYGKNSVGKSNLGLALFDITTHLGDKNVTPGVYDYYLNADSDSGFAEFHYIFKLADGEVDYLYRKNNERKLLFEKISINNELIMSYDYKSKSGDLEGLKKLVPSLNFEFRDESISILRYVVNNTLSDSVKPLKQLVRFVSNMLWFRSLDENRYIGYKEESTDYINFIFEEDNLKTFQELLHTAGVDEDLVAINDPDGKQRLYFNKKTPIPFFKVASNGTKALYTLYYWLTTATDVSFLFIDEFDAYYHFELSEMIVQLLEKHKEFQTILTSHNTNLLTNRIMRPDCYFILTPDKLTSLANATNRELREGHNLEKLYINGEFNE
ncbi:ATP-binding protein [Clostridium botulinum]|uniref:AAA family ATPase n=1 Tax=Clostridium botulinum TaxID=1491 RepID=UPI00052BB8E1|nr:ATP-binding protein [Clostridium botulinum]KGM95929.1 chromosome segregation protein SMC [Clostridium botulinum D str. CCUG 7971]KOC45694.1 chromosome segregation protein SMC [Clostridium botulinum]NFO98825.1 ATP-binding protein [Clostridium botulinum]OOV52618.1 chromosome segregation protein SMC [Clostridium botulinum D/C]OOV53280.1 chromosome segregation protein SMC [Clostridium botulinum D/C]